MSYIYISINIYKIKSTSNYAGHILYVDIKSTNLGKVIFKDTKLSNHIEYLRINLI